MFFPDACVKRGHTERIGGYWEGLINTHVQALAAPFGSLKYVHFLCRERWGLTSRVFEVSPAT